MTAVTFVFRSAPHSSSAGREGLDALLAASAYSEDLCALFIDDGVTQLVDNQDTRAIFSKHYAPMFKLLELYDIENVMVCSTSLSSMGFTASNLLIDAQLASADEITEQLHSSSKILTF